MGKVANAVETEQIVYNNHSIPEKPIMSSVILVSYLNKT
jgi:hypothetical protein